MTQQQMIDRLHLMLTCKNLPDYEKNLIEQAMHGGHSLIEVREVAAIFWARLDEHWGQA